MTQSIRLDAIQLHSLAKMMVSINSFKQGAFYAFCVCSTDDITQIGWTVGNRPPSARRALVIEDMYIVKIQYPERYIVELQLRHEITQGAYIGPDLVSYLMTESTSYGLYPEQENHFKQLKNRELLGDILAIISAVTLGMLIVLTGRSSSMPKL